MLPRRLDKYLRDSTPLSAPRARAAIEHGRVTLAESTPSPRPIKDPAWLVLPSDHVSLDGIRVLPRQTQYVSVLNKPKGVTSTTSDPSRRRDLSEYLAQMPEGTFPVGRLDRDTTGLLLFTTDGDLASALLRPDHGTEKVYWLWLDESVAPEDARLARLIEGIALPEGTARAKEARVLTRNDASTELLLTLDTGMNRQIRRMCFVAGLRLQHLHRRSLGGLGIEDVPLGSVKALSPEEVDILWGAAGGRENATRRRVEALEREAEKLRAQGEPHLRLEAWLGTRRENDS